MPRPTKQFPFDSNYDFEFRPETYWPNVPTAIEVLRRLLRRVRPTLVPKVS